MGPRFDERGNHDLTQYNRVGAALQWGHSLSRVETITRTDPRADRHVIRLDPDCGYLINPGSIGQPRDGDPRAAYVLYDSDSLQIAYFRVPYDVESAQEKIRKAGLPPILADRLAVGR